MIDDGSIEISVPSQRFSLGINTHDQIIGLINDEIDYWENYSSVFNGEVFLTKGNFIAETGPLHLRDLKAMTSLGNKALVKAIRKYLGEAEEGKKLILSSPMGQEIIKVSNREPMAARTIAACYTSNSRANEIRIGGGLNVGGDILKTLMAAPRVEFARKIETHLTELEDSAKTIEEKHALDRDAWTSWMKEGENRQEQLEKLYGEKLALEAPAQNWQEKYVNYIWASRLWKFVFFVMIGVILLSIYFGADAISEYLKKVAAGGSATAVLRGVVVISAPSLLYAWLLKHVSRTIILYDNLAVDASHRKTMVMTYLSLAKQKESGISETERSIILNALFRPAPPHTHDDGPPSGLIDLIRTKQQS